MNRIQGARVKAAALAHSRKQLANLGFRFKYGTSSATFEGDTAFAAWHANDDDWIASYRINYPALPDNALISRMEADFISAYTLHELGHIAFTKSGVTKGQRALIHHCWNGIEDARIEHAVIASGKARNARSMFKKLMGKFTVGVVAKGFNPCSINSAPFALALVCRAALGDGNGFAKQLLSRIPEPHRSLYAAAAEGVKLLPLDRSGSDGALQLAIAFVDSWKRQFPDTFTAPTVMPGMSSPPQSADDGEPADDSDSDEGGTPVMFDDVDADDQPVDDSGPSGHWTPPAKDDMFADQPDDGYGDGEDDDPEAAAEAAAAEAERDALADEAAANAEAAPESDDGGLLDGGDANDSDDDEGSDGAGNGAADPFVSADDDRLDERELVTPEPNIDDLFESVRNRTKGAINLAAAAPAARSEMRKWSKVAELSDRTVRNHFKKLQGTSLPALKAQLFRILKAPELCGWDGGAMGGRFDGKRAPRMFAGSEQVFKRRWFSDGVDTAVSVVIDLSGSMGGSSIDSAVNLGWAVANACEAAGTDVEVVGFQDAKYREYGGGYTLKGEWEGGSGSCESTLIVAKRFADKCASVAHQFGILKKLPSGGTPDYSAVKTACEQLSALPHKRKVVIVITDGFGEVAEMRALTESAYKLYGVDVIGFGIYASQQSFSQAYAVGCPVSLDSLHKSSLKAVISQLEYRDTRRLH